MASQQPPALRHLPCAASVSLVVTFGEPRAFARLASRSARGRLSPRYCRSYMRMAFDSLPRRLRAAPFTSRSSTTKSSNFVPAATLSPPSSCDDSDAFSPPLCGALGVLSHGSAQRAVPCSVDGDMDAFPPPLCGARNHEIPAPPRHPRSRKRLLAKPSDAELARRLAAAQWS